MQGTAPWVKKKVARSSDDNSLQKGAERDQLMKCDHGLSEYSPNWTSKFCAEVRNDFVVSFEASVVPWRCHTLLEDIGTSCCGKFCLNWTDLRRMEYRDIENIEEPDLCSEVPSNRTVQP